jgi:hypothetical protein
MKPYHRRHDGGVVTWNGLERARGGTIVSRCPIGAQTIDSVQPTGLRSALPSLGVAAGWLHVEEVADNTIAFAEPRGENIRRS